MIDNYFLNSIVLIFLVVILIMGMKKPKSIIFWFEKPAQTRIIFFGYWIMLASLVFISNVALNIIANVFCFLKLDVVVRIIVSIYYFLKLNNPIYAITFLFIIFFVGKLIYKEHYKN